MHHRRRQGRVVRVQAGSPNLAGVHVARHLEIERLSNLPTKSGQRARVGQSELPVAASILVAAVMPAVAIAVEPPACTAGPQSPP